MDYRVKTVLSTPDAAGHTRTMYLTGTLSFTPFEGLEIDAVDLQGNRAAFRVRRVTWRIRHTEREHFLLESIVEHPLEMPANFFKSAFNRNDWSCREEIASDAV